MTQQTQRTFARVNLLRTCYGLVTGKLVKWILAYKQHVNLKRQKTNLRYITIGLRKYHFNVDSKTDVLCTEHSSAITRRREEARPHQARAAGSPSLASRPTARPVRVVSADVQGAPWSGIAVYRRSLPASYISWQQTETSIRHSRGVGVSSSARTSAPVHSLWRAQRHGTSCRRIYGH